MAYSESDIKNLSGAAAVRAKPGMYLGPTDETGVFTILREVLDNARDENLNNHCKSVQVYIDDDGSYWAMDDGRGMPATGSVDIADPVTGKVTKVNTFHAITGIMHTGGKLDQGGKAYEVSTGSHGIGQKATNFVSTLFEVYSFCKGNWYFIQYKKGKLTEGPTKLKQGPDHPFRKGRVEKGTVVHFKPDPTIFSSVKMPTSLLIEWCTIASYFSNKLKITMAHHSGKEKEFYVPEGPKAYVADTIKRLKVEQLTPKIFVYQDALVDCLFTLTNSDGCEVSAFTNGLKNPERGHHFNTMLGCLHKALEPYVTRGQNFTASDLREGLVGVVNIKLSAPKFASQTKEKLVDDRAQKPLAEVLSKAMAAFFKENKAMAKQICERATELAKLKAQFSASKKTINELKKHSKKGLPSKAAVSPNCASHERELILVEGDSASGSCRQARDSHFQECLPLKGKPRNAARGMEAEKVLLNEEIMNTLSMIGFNAADTADPLRHMRVNKIIILADPDVDGPLRGDTKVLLPNGTQPTIEKLHKQFLKDQKPFWVWSQDSDGVLRLARATKSTLVNTVTEHTRVTLTDGTVLNCTHNHKWAVNFAKTTKLINHLGVSYARAADLRPGDSLVSTYFEKATLKGEQNESKRQYLFDSSVPRVRGSVRALHQIAMRDFNPEGFKVYRTKNKGSIGGAIHIHHKDDNPLNNDPANLAYLARREHYASHGLEWNTFYNGSDLQKSNMRKTMSENTEDGRARRKVASQSITAYNKSQIHRRQLSESNYDPELNKIRMLGKQARFALGLLRAGETKLTPKVWGSYKVPTHPRGMPYPENIGDLLDFYNKRKDSKTISPYPVVKQSVAAKITYPDRMKTEFVNVCNLVLQRESTITQELYELERIRLNEETGRRSTPKWETGRKAFGPNLKLEVKKFKSTGLIFKNHTVAKVETVKCTPTPMYCLTVPKYGNFLVADKNGHGVLSSNCHISSLMLAVFHRFIPNLFARGIIHVAKAPEYYAVHQGEVLAGNSADEVQKLLNAVKGKDRPHHLKGWGECPPAILRDLAFNPATRQLIKINPLTKDDSKLFMQIMGSDVEARKLLLGID